MVEWAKKQHPSLLSGYELTDYAPKSSGGPPSSGLVGTTLWRRVNAPLMRLLRTYGWIFDPPQGYRIDVTRLTIQWLVAGLFCGLLIWTFRTDAGRGRALA